MGLSNLDYTVFIVYVMAIIAIGVWLSFTAKNESATDYFLASKALPWWVVGGSLIASNISTEQILGMNGSGYVMGMAIATYELMAAATLLVVAKFFLPVFIKEGIFTMPQFLEKRYDSRVRTAMAAFWLLLFVFVNISSVLYLGGLAIETLSGFPLIYGIIFLVLYSATFSIFGGLKAVVWTDFIQVVILVIGGFIASYLVLKDVGGGFVSGLETLYEKAPDKFDMILSKSSPYYSSLPGITVILGGMWITNLYYWGNNQYIIQRALAAKSLKEAQNGVAFASFMKIFMPLIVVIPGIAAFVLGADLEKPDAAFPYVLNSYVGDGLKGLVFAALVAAIGSSISSIVNSASTIFTLDLYQPLINKESSQSNLVNVGKIAAGLALVTGAFMAPLLGSLDQVFQYIQEYTGFISPGVFVVFIFGLFWKRASARAALYVVVLAIPVSVVFKLFYPDIPFLDRMAISFILLSTLMVVLSLVDNSMESDSYRDTFFRRLLFISLLAISFPTGIKFLVEGGTTNIVFGAVVLLLSVFVSFKIWKEHRVDDPKAFEIDKSLFDTDLAFNISAITVITILTVFYLMFY